MNFGARDVACPSLLVRTLRDPWWRPGRACAAFVQLALGLVAGLFAATAFGADSPGAKAVLRQIEDTRAIAAEVSSAVRRVQTENLALRRTLISEVRNLTAEDITAAVLRLARTRCRYRAPALHDPGQSDRAARGGVGLA